MKYKFYLFLNFLLIRSFSIPNKIEKILSHILNYSTENLNRTVFTKEKNFYSINIPSFSNKDCPIKLKFFFENQTLGIKKIPYNSYVFDNSGIFKVINFERKFLLIDILNKNENNSKNNFFSSNIDKKKSIEHNFYYSPDNNILFPKDCIFINEGNEIEKISDEINSEIIFNDAKEIHEKIQKVFENSLKQ